MPAPPSSLIPLAAHRLTAPAALAPEQYRDLLGYLAEIADPRHRRGRRHTLATVLAVAVAAVLTGASSLAAIGEWAADAPGQVLAALGVCRDPWTDAFRPPGEATVRRVLARIDADALDRTIGAWLASQQPPPPSHPPRQAVAVDGKTLRGSGHHGQQQVHLLAAMDHPTRAVLGQSDVDTKTKHAKAVHPVHLPVVERRAQYLVDVARGHGQAGGDDQALRALLTAERLAPEEVRYQPAARALVAELLHRERAGRKPELRALAERVGAVA